MMFTLEQDHGLVDFDRAKMTQICLKVFQLKRPATSQGYKGHLDTFQNDTYFHL